MSTRRPVDPVTAYARDVLAGRIVAGRAVRMACQRHLGDLKRQRTAAFPYYFDRDAAEAIIDFFPSFLTLENGEPFVLPPWLQFCDGALYGWKVWGGNAKTSVPPEVKRRAGKRRFIYGFHETSKGSGKSPSAAGKGLYALAGFDDEPYGQIYCIAPETRVLCDDFRWRAVGDVSVGDGLIAFDEYPALGRRRKLRHAMVTSAERVVQPCYRVTFDDGRVVVASARHQWLGMKHARGELKGWWQTQELRVGSRVRDIGQPWSDGDSRDSGYLAGVYDGEGCFMKGSASRSGYRIAFAQRPGVVLDRTRQLLTDSGFTPSNNRSHASGVATFELGGLHECFRFLGEIRPSRLLATARGWYDGNGAKSKSNGYSTVVAIDDVGDREVVAIGTSTRTLFAEGFYSHNSCAYDKGQASIILNDAIRMARASEDLNAEYGGMLTIGTYNIANEANGSFFRAVSQETRGKSGPRPSMVLGDEIHEMRDGGVLNRLTAGFKFRMQPQALLYTNSGSDRTSLCWEYHSKSLAVLDGTQPDEQWFAYVCHLDPCERCYAEGYRQPKDGCPDCDDWTNPAVWPKVAPALGIVIQPKYQQDAIDMAMSVRSEYNLKRRLNFCLWTEAHTIWIPADHWDACRRPTVSEGNPAARPCTAGLDLSSKFDLSSLVIAIRHDDVEASSEPPEVVVIEGRDDTGAPVDQTISMNFAVELIPWFWLPEETLLERVRTERIPYDTWQRDGMLCATPGAVIDHEVIYQHIVGLWPTFNVSRLGYDPKDATMLATALRDRGQLGDQVLEVGQGKKLSEAFKLMEALIRSRRLWHNGNPVLAWNVGNAEPHRDRLGALWIEKPTDTKRIDGVIAAAMAIRLLMVVTANPWDDPNYQLPEVVL